MYEQLQVKQIKIRMPFIELFSQYEVDLDSDSDESLLEKMMKWDKLD